MPSSYKCDTNNLIKSIEPEAFKKFAFDKSVKLSSKYAALHEYAFKTLNSGSSNFFYEAFPDYLGGNKSVLKENFSLDYDKLRSAIKDEISSEPKYKAGTPEEAYAMKNALKEALQTPEELADYCEANLDLLVFVPDRTYCSEKWFSYLSDLAQEFDNFG